MTNKQKNGLAAIKQKAKTLSNKVYVGGVIAIASTPAFAQDIDLVDAGGLVAVSVVGGLMASGSLKALPTYVGWGIKKALSMLR